MADAEKQKLAYIDKLVAKLREKQAETHEITEEIQSVLSGNVALGTTLKELEAGWQTAWGARYGNTAYAWNYAKDRAQMKRLFKLLGRDELGRRIVTYIQNNDPFFTKGKHSFGLFVTTINQHATASQGDDLELEVEKTAARRLKP